MELLSARTRVLAGRMAGTADTVHDVGGRFGAVDGVDWQGATATEFRARLRALRTSTTALAVACDDTAGRLSVHAGNVAVAEQHLAVLLRTVA